MAIQLATDFKPYVDEVMTKASTLKLVAGAEFNFTGANTIKLYKVGTAPMQDYGRNQIKEGNWSHYGAVTTLDATTEEMTLKKDRSFTFEIDKLDEDETKGNLEAASALNRQLREKVLPEIEVHSYGEIIKRAGLRNSETAELTEENIYAAITAASVVLDEAEVPEEGRYILVTPEVLRLMKLNNALAVNEDIGKELRQKGAVAALDGAAIIKVLSKRMPEGFKFLYGHPMAAAAPVKLADYKIHKDPPGLSGSLVEGRINYDAFVLDNKVNALYLYSTKAAESGTRK